VGFLDRLLGDGGDDGGEAADARRDASLAAVEAGGLPLNAQERLRQLAAVPDPLFTSNLSVNGFVLGDELGLDPVCQVMGSSIYKMGWQMQGWQTGELSVQTEALNHSRALALGRLRQEAQLAGADAVVGVTVSRGEHEFVGDGIEFIAQGTAVRVRGTGAHPPGGEAALTDLGVADYWKLLRAGYESAGIVAASTVYYIVATWATRRAQGGWLSGRNNQELVDFTQGVYTARELALSNLVRQTRDWDAEGIVGVDISQHVRTREAGSENNKREDLIVTFHVIGTAIRRRGGGEIAVRPIVSQGVT
jgi:uncharacterized protein YbjQ (UPF0145 family)